MGVKLRDFFKDKEVDFTKVSFFDDLVEYLIDTNKNSAEYIIEVRGEEYLENKLVVDNTNNNFSWVEVSEPINVSATYLIADAA